MGVAAPLLRRSFDRWLYGAFLLTRVGLLVLLFVVLHIEPRGDVIGYYVPEGFGALHGGVPYRDFESSYAPLHAYMDAAVLRVWGSARALMLFAVLVEFAGLPLWLGLGRRVWPERDVRAAAVLYLLSALSLQFVTIDGQDNVVIALLLAASFVLIGRRRELLAGVLLGLSAVAVKLIPLGYIPVIWAGTARRWRWLAGVLLAVGVGYGAFAGAVGRAVLMPLAREGGLRSAGDLPYVLEGLSGRILPGGVSGLVLAGMEGAILVRVLRVSRRSAEPAVRLQAMVLGVVAATLALELLAKKSWPAYLMLVLFPLLVGVVRSGGPWSVAGMAGFSAVAMVEHSYWASLLGQFDAATLHQGLVRGDGRCFVFLLLEVLLVVGYGWLLRMSWRQMAGPAKAPARSERPEGQAGV